MLHCSANRYSPSWFPNWFRCRWPSERVRAMPFGWHNAECWRWPVRGIQCLADRTSPMATTLFHLLGVERKVKKMLDNIGLINKTVEGKKRWVFWSANVSTDSWLDVVTSRLVASSLSHWIRLGRRFWTWIQTYSASEDNKNVQFAANQNVQLIENWTFASLSVYMYIGYYSDRAIMQFCAIPTFDCMDFYVLQ